MAGASPRRRATCLCLNYRAEGFVIHAPGGRVRFDVGSSGKSSLPRQQIGQNRRVHVLEPLSVPSLVLIRTTRLFCTEKASPAPGEASVISGAVTNPSNSPDRM